MRKFKRLTMTLALLIAAVSGAWADYTVTWEGTTLQGIAVKNNTATTSQTVEGITVTASNGYFFYNTTDPKGPVVTASSYADNGLVFSAENNIKSIAITFTEIASYGGSTTFGAGAYTYQVSPAAKSFALPKNDSFTGITKVVFTLEGDAPIELTPDDTGKNWILAEMPASNIELQVEYEPTKVTMAVNDNAMGTVEVSGESKVEWTADTWNGWTANTKEYTVDDITMTSTQNAYINEITEAGDYLHSLSFFVNENEDNSTVTFSTTGDPFTRIEFAMIRDYNPGEGSYHGVPNIQPADGWTFSGKSAVWEGEATKSLTLQSCSTFVSKITFFKGAIPDGVTVNGDGTFTVAKTATVTLTATPAEGYKFKCWEDAPTNTNPVRKVTIESGLADMTYTAVFEEILYNVTFVEGTNLDEWKAEPKAAAKNIEIKVTYSGAKKVIGMKVEKKSAYTQLSAVTTSDIGKVVCAAGHLHDAKTAVPDGCTAVGILGKVTETGHGLILALKDAAQQTWNTIDGWTSVDTYASTTLKVLPDDAARGTNLTSYTTLGETTVTNWAVAQKSDYEAIFQNLGSTKSDQSGYTYDSNVNAYITTGVGGDAISGNYWSATDGVMGNAWRFVSDYWITCDQTSSNSVRPVLGF